MSLNLSTLLAVGFGGFFGAILRVVCVHFIHRHFFTTLPFGILFVNVVGSFIMGLLFALFMHVNSSEEIKSFFMSGFLGALTTYSTFAIESFLLFNTSVFLAFSNIALNLVGSIGFAAFGYKLITVFLK